MKRITVLLAISPLAAIAGPTESQPIDALKPMAFLAGHCWKGSFAGGKQTDEHCFSWLYGGKALRDVHTVRAPERPDYVGETTYYWDGAARKVQYLYIENLGGVSRGVMEPVDSTTLSFPPTQYVADGEAMTYRVRWTRLNDSSYEAWSEVQQPDGWATMFKLVLQRSDN